MPAFRYTTIAVIVLAFVVAAVAVRIAHTLIHRALDALEIVGPDDRAAVHARAGQLIRALTILAYGVAAVASISFAFERLGVSQSAWHPRFLLQWMVTHGVNVAIIFVGAFIVVRAANLAIEHLQFKLGPRHATTDLEWQRRAATLGGILTSLVTVTVAFVAILMVMRELTVDVVPILTGAGIAGLAIGFGAQNLVRDVISGFFLILEDQVRVGDLARINGVAGTVEQVNLRTIILRDVEGAVQVFPTGRSPRLRTSVNSLRSRSSTCASPTARTSTACWARSRKSERRWKRIRPGARWSWGHSTSSASNRWQMGRRPSE